MVHNHVKLPGVHPNSAKRIVTSSSNEIRCDSKTLLNITELLQTNAIEAVTVMFGATLDSYQCCVKSDEHTETYSRLLEKSGQRCVL